jgi:signal transduction histidine kinase
VYLNGILLLVLVAIALAIAGAAVRRGWPAAHPPGAFARWAAERISDVRADPARLRLELERAREALGVDATVWQDEAVLATNVEPPLPAPPAAQRARIDERDGRPVRMPGRFHAFAMPLAGIPPAYLVFSGGPPSFPLARLAAAVGAVLLALALASVPLARAIASPIERLTGAVQAFGAGDLSARARVSGPGEVGQLSRAFDEMADRIERLLRAERELLANVSHELRTPLARIRVALELAAEGDAERARRGLGEIGADLAEVDRIVEDVLTAARLEAGGGALTLRRERVAAGDLLATAAERFRGAHPDRKLVVAPPDATAVLEADPVLLRRALDNLLDNAAKYSDPAAQVELSAAASGDRLRIAVRDHGIGIAPEDLPRLFTPFFRAERSRARAGGGTGLGLVLAKRIVEAHGGAIAVESAAGEGTLVTIDVPAGTAAG